MNGGTQGSGMSWTARLLIGLVLLLVGAAAATWALARYQPAAKFLGVVQPAQPTDPQAALTPKPFVMNPQLPQGPAQAAANDPEDAAKISTLEQRLQRVEQATQRTESFAGRADALVVAFAARRAIDRGVALGYLEPLLVDRFGAQHQAAVATVITASRQPVRLNDLTSEYEAIGEDLRRGGPEESWWAGLKRELGSVVEVHHANRPAMNADARYNRALARLNTGDVDQALAETMRLPGASRAGDWTNKARRYVAAHRALDEIESAALLGGQGR
jgi:hypothetical protein